MLSRSILIGVVMGLCACATPSTMRMAIDKEAAAAETALQKELAFKKRQEYLERLNSVSYRLLKASYQLCADDVGHAMGISGGDINSFHKSWRTEAQNVLQLGDFYSVTWVANGGAGERAGLRVNDQIVSLNGIDFGETKKDRKKFYQELARIKTARDAEVALTVRRDAQFMDIEVQLDRVCNFPVVLQDADAVNAYADGKQIVITRGMMRFASDDTALSLVVAHELGHNAMGHMDKQMTNYALGSILDIAAAAYGVNTNGLFGKGAAGAYSQDFEAEADYVALYYMQAADLPIESAANFWRSMAAEHPASIKANHASSHPATSERFLAIEKTVAEINSKLASGRPLVPTLIEK